MNLRGQETNHAIGLETQTRHHQKSKTDVSVAQQKGLMSSENCLKSFIESSRSSVVIDAISVWFVNPVYISSYVDLSYYQTDRDARVEKPAKNLNRTNCLNHYQFCARRLKRKLFLITAPLGTDQIMYLFMRILQKLERTRMLPGQWPIARSRTGPNTQVYLGSCRRGWGGQGGARKFSKKKKTKSCKQNNT